ncbi:membrane protein [Gigaspora margarita]|uniref:Membrane protein n=1 Tax=Gigaspora margarita TaxID=4874 RepID=A0A8H4APH9_GIGMA|nr:membrane protein [Gigaspora margarita]
MTHLKGSNRIENEDHTSSTLLEQNAPSTVLELPTPSTLKINSTQKTKRKLLLLSLLMIVIDLVVPLILYFILSNYIPAFLASAISGTIPFVSIIINFIFLKRVDTNGILSTTGFITATILSIIQDNTMSSSLQPLRQSIHLFTTGLVLLFTLIPLKVGSFQMRPLLYHNFKNMGMGNLKGLTEDEPIPERWERYWRTFVEFRRTIVGLTAVWGFCLMLDVPIRILVIYKTKTPEQAFFIGSIVTFAWMQCPVIFSVIYVKLMKNLLEKRLKEKESNTVAAIVNNEI